jgi:hypothetical protein
MTGIRPSLIAASRRRFNPLSLSPALWLSDTGSSAGTWPDLSGNGRDATQADSAKQPAIITNALNGRQVRRFDGSNDFMETVAFSLPQPYTTWAVFQSNTTTTLSVPVRGSRESVASSGVFLIGHRATVSAVTGINAGTLHAPFATVTTWQIFCTVGNGANSLAFRNGQGAAVGNAGTNSISRVGLGVSTADTAFFAGDIAEVLILPYNPSTADRQKVESYLSNKWGIALA